MDPRFGSSSASRIFINEVYAQRSSKTVQGKIQPQGKRHLSVKPFREGAFGSGEESISSTKNRQQAIINWEFTTEFLHSYTFRNENPLI
jgi:hypothetical protein